MFPRPSRFAWSVLGWNVAVILWGAYVRASGSGAGCGTHWPLCNGEVVPLAPTTQMVVEFSHRVTSGLALLSVVALAVWTWRAAPAGHPARRTAGWSMFFMLTEAAVGAALVLFRLVADNASMARAMFMSVHLVNTFTLLACLALTAWWLSGGDRVRLAGRGRAIGWLVAGTIAIFTTGVSGAVAALGDTLYPAGSLAAGLAADLSATSRILIRLRVLHPVIAVLVGFALMVAGERARRGSDPMVARFGRFVSACAAAQIAAGFVNVLLLAPIWMQLVHLWLADAVWVSFVLLGASALAERPVSGSARPLAGFRVWRRSR